MPTKMKNYLKRALNEENKKDLNIVENKSFKSGHGRKGEIWVDKNEKCDVCNKKTKVLCIDSSDDEYGPGCICGECFEKMMNK